MAKSLSSTPTMTINSTISNLSMESPSRMTSSSLCVVAASQWWWHGVQSLHGQSLHHSSNFIRDFISSSNSISTGHGVLSITCGFNDHSSGSLTCFRDDDNSSPSATAMALSPIVAMTPSFLRIAPTYATFPPYTSSPHITAIALSNKISVVMNPSKPSIALLSKVTAMMASSNAAMALWELELNIGFFEFDIR